MRIGAPEEPHRCYNPPSSSNGTMNITTDELLAEGFWRAGTVFPDALTTLRVQIDRDAHGFVVYIMVVEQEFMKAGKTETALSTRMHSTFNSLKNKMGLRADHPRYQEKTFKEHAQATIRAGKQIELWAQDMLTFEAMMAREDELNRHYRGLWTKEGRS
jgi:hypothetical protein